MKDDEILILIQYRIKQAEESLEDAKALLDGGRSPRSIINRSYYAMFYTIIILIQSSQLRPAIPGQIQDLGDIIPELLDIKAKESFSIKFRVQIIAGEGDEKPDEATLQKIDKLLSGVNSDLELK